jgi:hypothetical protein
VTVQIQLCSFLALESISALVHRYAVRPLIIDVNIQLVYLCALEQRRMFYDKYGSQGYLDCRDVGIELDRVDLSRPSTVNGVVNGNGHYPPPQPQRTGGVTMKDARGCGTPYKHLRDPDEVFYEAFGSREPPSNGFGERREWTLCSKLARVVRVCGR